MYIYIRVRCDYIISSRFYNMQAIIILYSDADDRFSPLIRGRHTERFVSYIMARYLTRGTLNNVHIIIMVL